MPDYTEPDRQLAELWRISEIVTEAIRDDIAQLHASVAEWEPAPMPDHYRPSKEDFT
jgi:hypothetical protein